MAGAGDNTNLPHPLWSGSFTICGIELKCHTLSDGKRIIEEDSMEAFFTAFCDRKITAADAGADPDAEGFRRWYGGGA